jgi:hypothetical protein
MSDLVERLRTVESSGTRQPTTNWYRNPDGVEAADAIERLTAERDRLAADLAEARELLYRGRQLCLIIALENDTDEQKVISDIAEFLSRTEGADNGAEGQPNCVSCNGTGRIGNIECAWCVPFLSRTEGMSDPKQFISGDSE